VVNGAALLLLVLGFFLLSSFHTRDEQDIREGSMLLDPTERRLIEDIRRETSRLLAEKEKEINDIFAALAEAGAEYKQLQLSVDTLTENQKARSEYLFILQKEYQDILSRFQEERARILENSRLREIALRSRAEERAGTRSLQVEQNEAGLHLAMEELSRLSQEQQYAAATEAQLRGYYVLVNERIKAGELSEATDSLQGMREFLNAPLFYSTRSMEARRLVHLTALSVMEDAVAIAIALETGIPSTVLVPPNPSEIENAAAPLLAKISELEQVNQDQERLISVLNSQDSSRTQLITEYNNRISNLQGQLTTSQTQAANQQTQISNLQGQLTSSQAQVSSQQQTINQRDTAIQGLRDQNAAQEQRVTQLTRTTENLQQQMDSIPQVVSRTIEDPAIQDLLGPVARQALVQEIQQAIRQAIQQQ
jgi:chromosome segregation ATPase